MVWMTTALIIGSGAAAAGVALALSHRENLEITVIDIGLQLESDREQLIGDLASSSPDEWDRQLIELTSRQPAASRNSGIPEKRVFGSEMLVSSTALLRLTVRLLLWFRPLTAASAMYGAPSLCLLRQQHLRVGQ